MFTKIISWLMSIIMSVLGITGFTPREKAENFRVTAYIVENLLDDEEGFDVSHLSQVTDIILIGGTTFNEKGEVSVNERLPQRLAFLRNAIGDRKVNIYMNFGGPGATTDSDDWTEQMMSISENNIKCFRSGRLERNIKKTLAEYGFDGAFFDLEYLITDIQWLAYDNFIMRLNAVLGSKYKIGMALSAWNANQSAGARAVTDMVEVMSYDLWDENGYHATQSIAEDDLAVMLDKGYTRAQLDMGIPFYARPTTKEAYWYNYKDCYTDLTENGLYSCPETGLTFSFNTYEDVYEKTLWAIGEGTGGVFMWHYSCDVPADNSLSLFNAITEAREAALNSASDKLC